jgi:phosphoglycolate phosphatase-like HAD superfamily hydrolase
MNLAVFDIDGTLTEPYGIEDFSFLEGLELAFGFRDVDPDWTKYPHVTDTGIVTHLCLTRWGRPPTPSEMARFQEAYSKSFLARVSPEDGREISGAAELITGLRNANDWCVSVATGNCVRMALLKLTRGGIPCLDLPMATADDGISRAALVRLAIDRAEAHYGVTRFRHVVSVGDAPWDLMTARELELPFVVIGTTCGDVMAPHMLTDYMDKPAAVDALARAVCW